MTPSEVGEGEIGLRGLCFPDSLVRRQPDPSDTIAVEKLAPTTFDLRMVIYQLADLGLPIEPYWRTKGGLAFDLLSSLSEGKQVIIGHAGGVITIDLAETLDAHRERLRVSAYRHFADLDALLRAYHERTLGGLIDRLRAAVGSASDGSEMLARACRAWVDEASRWGGAAAHLRRPEGILVRKASGDKAINELFDVLEGVLGQLSVDGVVDAPDMDYAAMIWVTVFDERVIVDLGTAKGWSVSEIATRLETTLVAALSPRHAHL